MMLNFSFIHAADLHLDAPFKGIYGQDELVARELVQATYKSFDALVELCIQEEVDFLLIAGDVYNSQVRSLKGQLKFLEGIKKLASQDIQVFVVHGNHDPVGTQSMTITWPENVYFFPAEDVVWKVVKNRYGKDVALVGGVSHSSSKEQRNLARQFDPPGSDLFKIGLLHANVGNLAPKAPYAPCQLSDLISRNIDYWALGHIHERRVLHKDPYVVYAGNIQGLHINESGERGCYLVRVFATEEVDIQFKPLARLIWCTLEIDIGNFSSINQVQDAIISKCLSVKTSNVNGFAAANPGTNSESGERGGSGESGERGGSGGSARPFICRIKLTGKSPLGKELNRDDVLEEMLSLARDNLSLEEPFVWVKDILMDVETQTLASLQGDGLLAEIIRISNEFEQEPERLGPVLSDLLSHHKIRKIVPELSLSEAQNLIRQARLLCWDGLK
jgi:DNA repair exonuclease SbcCD nuclease subunit